jgi:hypothetical protein
MKLFNLDSLFPTPRTIDDYRTANSAEMRLSAMISANAPDVSAINNDEWFVICPFGEFPSPDRSYTQMFGKAEADEVLRTWNSIPGTAARWFKNKWHRLTSTSNGAPGWDGHPETDKNRWPVERLLCEVTDLRVTENALEGKITWNAKGMERRTRGPLFPSPIFWHNPPDAERRVFPALLESIGLVPTPNIASVPAWTQNASPEATAEENQTSNTMDRKKLIAQLGLGADATDEQITGAIATLQSTANTATDSLTTANAAKQTLETQLSTANGRVTTLETANGILIDGVLDLFEAAGKFTPAQRGEIRTKFTANIADSATVITELKSKKPEINTRSLEINGNRVDLSTANARQTALESAVTKRMSDDKCDRDTAFAKVQADPAYAQLFAAMKPAPAAAA